MRRGSVEGGDRLFFMSLSTKALTIARRQERTGESTKRREDGGRWSSSEKRCARLPLTNGPGRSNSNSVMPHPAHGPSRARLLPRYSLIRQEADPPRAARPPNHPPTPPSTSSRPITSREYRIHARISSGRRIRCCRRNLGRVERLRRGGIGWIRPARLGCSSDLLQYH